MKRNIYFLLSSLLVLSILISGCGGDSSSGVVTPASIPTPGTPSTATSVITGTVYGTDGVPVDGATVTLTPLTASEASGEVQTATTASGGLFSFTVSFAGVYVIEAKLGTTLLDSKQFTVTLGSNISMLLGNVTGKLTVQVTPANALATVSVSFIETASTTELPASQTGEYVFYLPAGTYTVTVSATGYNTVTRPGIILAEGEEKTEAVDLTAGEIPVGLNAVSPRVIVNAGDLSSILMTIKGSDFTGATTVSLTPSGGGTAIEGTNVQIIDSITVQATFNLSGLASGQYNVSINHSPPIASSNSSVSSTLWFVDTIQGAIDRANAIYGEENPSLPVNAFVPAGNYLLASAPFQTVPLYIKSGVHLQGAGITAGITPTVLRNTGGGAGPVFNNLGGLPLTDFILEGFTLEGANFAGGIAATGDINNITLQNNSFTGFSGGVAIVLNPSMALPSQKNFTISNNIVNNNNIGIVYTGNNIITNLTINNNTINNNTSLASQLISNLPPGFTSGTQILNITDNILSGNQMGISGQSQNNAEWTVTGNNISGTVAAPGMQLVVALNGNCNVENNNFTGNLMGLAILCNTNSNAIIKGNEVSNSTTAGGMNVSAATFSTADISGNTVTGNAYPGGAGGGILANWDNTSTLTIRGNEITGNSANTGGGLYLTGPADSGDFVNQNNIYDNTDTTPGEGGKELYYNGPPTLNADNNWWGPGSILPSDPLVFKSVDPGKNVDTGTPAAGQFTPPVIP